RFTHEFKFIKEIGSGAFGRVVEAEHFLDKWKYAVKQIAFQRKEDKVEKILREVQTMAKFDHPNIVRYYGAWIERPPQVFFFKFRVKLFWSIFYMPTVLCNYSLEDWLSENEQQPRDHQKMRVLFKQLVEAVAYIHSKDVIHRDLKPSNILFDEKDGIRVCDLGIATEIFEAETLSTRTITGTPLYSGPEQSSWRYGRKVDVFALGLIYAEMSVNMTSDVRE
ncbi:hypothetical protein PFISCL1PPCAC_3126, partial [Pristionchus fissidentatus]